MSRKLLNKNNRGFTAFTVVVLLSTGLITFTLTSIASALLFSDSINQREYRIQANLNADSCLEVAELIAYKDYFVNGNITLHDFNCTINISNNFIGNVHISVEVDFLGIKIRREKSVNILYEI